MCGKPVTKPKRGPSPKTCGQRCRKRLSRSAPTPVFPREMLDAPRWVRAAGKRPIMPSGAPASSTDPSTWSPYSAVQDGAGDGMGFMLGDGVGCIDLDGCLDAAGQPLEWARREIEDWGTDVLFMERSVSGRGVHVFVRADERPGQVVGVSGGGRVERYFYGRFILTTGDRFEL